MSELPCSKVSVKRKWVIGCKLLMAVGTLVKVRYIMEFVLLEAVPSLEIIKTVVVEKQKSSLALEDF